MYIAIAINKLFGHYGEDPVCSCWAPLNITEWISNLLTGLFCKGQSYIHGDELGCGITRIQKVQLNLWLQGLSFKRCNHLAWYQARFIPVLLHWIKLTQTFDSQVLMRRLAFLWNFFCCSHHLRPTRNVPGVGMLDSARMTLFVLAAHWVVSQNDRITEW